MKITYLVNDKMYYPIMAPTDLSVEEVTSEISKLLVSGASFWFEDLSGDHIVLGPDVLRSTVVIIEKTERMLSKS